MLNRRPLTWGLILGASSHLIEWIPILLAAFNQWDAGFWIGIAAVLAHNEGLLTACNRCVLDIVNVNTCC